MYARSRNPWTAVVLSAYLVAFVVSMKCIRAVVTTAISISQLFFTV
jgi:hypothetical protein